MLCIYYIYGGLRGDDLYMTGEGATFLNRYYGGLTVMTYTGTGEGWPFSVDIMDVWREMTYTAGEGVTFRNRYYGGLTDDDVYRNGGRVTFLNRYYGGLTGDDVYRDGGRGDLSQ